MSEKDYVLKKNKISEKKDLENFLIQGEAPIVFTLGSARIHDPGFFFEESLKAIEALQARAVIIAGKQAEALKKKFRSSLIYITDYLPFPEIFPRAKIIVHQGGIGTTAQALRAGKPTLIVPQCHDQPDNAFRIKKLGVTQVLPQHHYRTKNLVEKLNDLIEQYSSYSEKAAYVRERILRENGLEKACNEIETCWQSFNLI